MALFAAVRVVRPVPPKPTPKVPDIDIVPEVVIGLLLKLKPVEPPDTPTLVTPAEMVEIQPDPSEVKTLPAVPGVESPVPPLVAPRAEARVSDERAEITLTTLVPSTNNHIVFPAGTAIPVPREVLTVMASARPLLTM